MIVSEITIRIIGQSQAESGSEGRKSSKSNISKQSPSMPRKNDYVCCIAM